MIKTNANTNTLASITPKKLVDAIESGVSVIVEERHTDTHCKTHYTQLAMVNGELFKISRTAFNRVSKVNGGSWYADCTTYGGYEGYSFNC